jgi:ElaB/YqjD/DUF883 family membrane-anchored ribosome-binding protein
MVTNTTDETSRGTLEEAQQKGSELLATTQEQVAGKARELRQDAAFALTEQVDRRSTQVGDEIEAVARALQSAVADLRSEGKTSSSKFVDGIAERTEKLGNYLRSTDAERALDDVEQFARRRPWLTAGTAAVAGFVASRFLKASSDRRYEGRRELPRETAIAPAPVPSGGTG